MLISFIACPVDWRHQLDFEDYVCTECGAEAVEMPLSDIKKLVDDNEPDTTSTND